jgi:hypothetical protein
VINITNGAPAGAPLGDLFWWLAGKVSDPAAVEATVPQGDVLRACLPPVPKDVQAFARSAKVASERGKFDVRRVVNTDDEVSFAVAEVGADSTSRRATYQHASTCDLDIPSGVARFDGTSAKAIHDEYQRLRGKYGGPEWMDLGRSFVKASAAIPVRKEGGVYWLPYHPQWSPALRRLAAVFSAFNGRVSIAPQYATDETKAAVGASAKDAFMAELVDVAECIKGFGERTRAKTVEDRLGDLAELRTRAEWVSGLLSESAAGLLAMIKPLEAACVEAMLGDTKPANAIDLGQYQGDIG